MYAEFHAAVYELLVAAVTDVGVWDYVPDDINEVPCVVVGRPSGAATFPVVVFDLELPVYVVGRRQQAGSEAELLALVDRLFTVLGETRGAADWKVARVAPTVVTIAGLECPAYTVEVHTSTATC